jgi:Dyp-type peroxidase family
MAIDFADVQGNVVDGYPRSWELTHGLYTFLRIEPDQREDARAFLADVIREVTCGDQRERVEAAVNVAITCPGLEALGVHESVLESFPRPFREGMRERAALLGDDPDTWDVMWNEAVHVLVSIHGNEKDLEKKRQWLRGRILGRGLINAGEQKAARIIEGDIDLEHFGFADGISNPAIEGTASGKDKVGGKWECGRWHALAAGEFLLGHEDEAAATPNVEPPELGRNGTFLVYRKLRQRVGRFRRYTDELAKVLGTDRARLEEKMVGRKPGGDPITELRTLQHRNDFTYANDSGSGCPMGAHVRRMHPRAGNVRGLPDLSSRHRIIRRGIPYGERAPAGLEVNDDDDRGLLFIALNADIERQFEFLQSRYVNDGDAARQAYDKDPLVGDNQGRGSMVIPADEDEPELLVCEDLPTFVETLGGDYFFAAGLKALQGIADGRWRDG